MKLVKYIIFNNRHKEIYGFYTEDQVVPKLVWLSFTHDVPGVSAMQKMHRPQFFVNMVMIYVQACQYYYNLSTFLQETINVLQFYKVHNA